MNNKPFDDNEYFFEVVDDDEDFSNLDQTLNKNNLDSINLGTNPSFRKQQAHIPKASNAKASSIEPILKLKANCNFISSFKEFCDGQIEKPNIETYPNPNGGGFICLTKISGMEFEGFGLNKGEAKSQSSEKAIKGLVQINPRNRTFFGRHMEILWPELKVPLKKDFKDPKITEVKPSSSAREQNELEEQELILAQLKIQKKLSDLQTKKTQSSYNPNNNLSMNSNSTSSTQKNISEPKTLPITSNIKALYENMATNEPSLLYSDAPKTFLRFKQDLEIFYYKELVPEKAQLKTLSDYHESLNLFFSNFLKNYPNKGLKILPIGSFITNSLRKNKLEIDLVIINEEKEEDKKLVNTMFRELKGLNQFTIELLADMFEGEYIKALIKEEKELAFNIFVLNPKTEGYSGMRDKRRLNGLLEVYNEYLSIPGLTENEDLLKLRRILKNWGDGILLGEYIDAAVINVTKRFTRIDLMNNVKEFFELVALGGLSNMKNSWLWDGFSEIYKDFFEDVWETIEPRDLEKKAQLIIKNSDFKQLIGL